MSRTRPPAAAERRLRERRQSTVRIFSGSVLVVAILYFARQVFIPIALAILFAFLLRPIVSRLERTFLRRTGSVVLAVGLAVALLLAGTWAITQQISTLATEVAKYSGNLERKLAFIRGSGGSIALVERMLQRLAASAERQESPDLKVRVIPEAKTLGQRYAEFAPTVEYAASAFLVVVLVFFLLKDREQLRDRLLRLAGTANLTVTTQAIGETIHRISRYLLTQALLNVGFGLLIGIGLFAMGMPQWLLWGVLAALLRFVPYVGAVLSAALPTFLAAAVFPGWYVALGVLALFLLVDQLLAGFIEPMVIGHRVGVSPIALLVAAIFWGWLWGPVGLLLATPITVCLTVAGEFIPALRPFSILFGTESALEDYLTYYNRLLTGNRGKAIAIADRYSEEHSMEAAFTDLFIPTLTFANQERERGRITSANDHFIKDITRELIVRLGDRNARGDEDASRVVAVSVARERLSLGTLMLVQLLRSEGLRTDIFTDLPTDDLLPYIEDASPIAVLVSCSEREHLDAGFELLTGLSRAFPELIIFAGGSAFTTEREAARAAGATYVPTHLADARSEFSHRVRPIRRRRARTA